MIIVGGLRLSNSTTTYAIHSPIFLSIDEFAIKNLIESIEPEILKEPNEKKIQGNRSRVYGTKLNKLINEGKISSDSVQRFLLENLLFGKMNRVSFFRIDSGAIAPLKNPEYIKNMLIDSKAITTPDEIKTLYYISDLKESIKDDKPQLLHLDIKTEEDKVEELTLLIGQRIRTSSDSVPIYYSVHININDEICTFRFKNWEEISSRFNEAQHPKQIIQLIKKIFSINLNINPVIAQNVVKAMSKDLIEPVLKPIKQTVDKKMCNIIEQDVEKWIKQLNFNSVATIEEKRTLIDHVLNHLYGLGYSYNAESVTSKTDVEKLGGYVSYIRFTDDTVSEAKAKSATVEDSLLDTNVYYDLKVRLDKSSSVKLSTYQFLNVPSREKKRNGRLGVSIHTETENQLQCVLKCSSYDREVYEYVLQKVKGYIVSQRGGD